MILKNLLDETPKTVSDNYNLKTNQIKVILAGIFDLVQNGQKHREKRANVHTKWTKKKELQSVLNTLKAYTQSIKKVHERSCKVQLFSFNLIKNYKVNFLYLYPGYSQR